MYIEYYRGENCEPHCRNSYNFSLHRYTKPIAVALNVSAKVFIAYEPLVKPGGAFCIKPCSQ